MTYAQAHNIILNYLMSNGWTLKTRHRLKPMKVPHATSPDGGTRLYFKAQAIYVASSPSLELKHARPLFAEETERVKVWARWILVEQEGRLPCAFMESLPDEEVSE